MWLIAFLLTIALAQPVNIAVAVESEIDQTSSEEISTDVNTDSETVTDPQSSSPTDTNLPDSIADSTASLDPTPHGTALSSSFTFETVDAADCTQAATRSNIANNDGTEAKPFIIADYADLLCMQELVNNNVTFTVDADTYTYRTDKYWQFSSFSANSATFSPIGTKGSPFSGYLVGDGPVSVSGLTISGADSVGLLGATEDTVSIKDLELKDVTVSGENSVGAWVGSAEGTVQLTDVSVTGAIWATGDQVGGAVGSAVGALTTEDVSVSGDIWTTGDTVGGVVGSVAGTATEGSITAGPIWPWGFAVGGQLGSTASGAAFSNVVFDGTVSGSATLGGLLGAGADTVNITEAAVRLNVDVTGDNPASYIGGLIGTLSNAESSFSLRVDNSIVTGTISGKSHLGGLVGALNDEKDSNISATISSVVTAVELSAQTEAVAGLINTLSASEVDLKSVLNLAQVVSSATADGYQQVAALVSSSATPALTHSQAYRWQGLSASAATYHPFTSGTVSGTAWKFNGDELNCAEFSQFDFWSNTDSMNLQVGSGWNFDAIGNGYLPSLNGQFADVPFSCMNEITYPEDWSSVTASSDFGYAIVPIVGGTGSAHYFMPAQTSTNSLIHRFNAGYYAPFDIYYNGTLVQSQVANDANWQFPAEGLLTGATISLQTTSSSQNPEFQFNFSKSNTNLLLSWSTQYAKSVSITFTTPTNLAGGTPPGISRSKFTYSGAATTYTWNLGAPPAGTYVISVNGSILGIGQEDSQTVAATQTWTNYLTVATPEASISFPDVFTGSAKTITYKNNGKVTVSRVPAVNASRYAAIRWLASVAVTAGSQSDRANRTTFRAQDAVNRGAMAQFLQKLAGFTDAQIAAQYQGKANKFTDTTSLQKSNPARYYAILWLADTGITAGCNTAGTKFCPGNTVNRGAMAEFMRKFAGVTATSASTSPFPDVNLTAKNVKYDGSSKAVKVSAVNAARMGAINWMRTTGITAGSGSSGGVTTYRPQDPVNRGAMAEFMRKLAQKVGSTK